MITVVQFLWFNPNERRNSQYVYTCHNVNRAKRAISANLRVPHRFVVVSDRSEGFDPDIKVVPLDMSAFPHRGRYPKLMVFRHDAAELFGERILMVDLDVCVAGDLTPLVERKEDVVFWDGNPDPRFAKKGHPLYNTSIVLLRAGSRPEVWDRFDRETTPALVKAENKDGSDQVWVSKIIPGEATWDQKDGIYLAREIGATLPGNARLVFFPGKENPSLKSTRRRYPWAGKRLIASAT
jgi:hypothetical protein